MPLAPSCVRPLEIGIGSRRGLFAGQPFVCPVADTRAGDSIDVERRARGPTH